MAAIIGMKAQLTSSGFFAPNLVIKEVCIPHVLLEDLILTRIYRTIVNHSF